MGRMRAADHDHRYSVAWIDTLARGRRLGRSVLTRGSTPRATQLPAPRPRPAGALAGPPRLGAAGRAAPAWSRGRRSGPSTSSGSARRPAAARGELQTIAAVLPPARHGRATGTGSTARRASCSTSSSCPTRAEAAVAEVLRAHLRRRAPVVPRRAQALRSRNPGPLSFPLPGWTLALDVPADPRLGRCSATLDRLVVAAGGRLYLAKDSRVRRRDLRRMYPRLDDFRERAGPVDPTACSPPTWPADSGSDRTDCTPWSTLSASPSRCCCSAAPATSPWRPRGARRPGGLAGRAGGAARRPRADAADSAARAGPRRRGGRLRGEDTDATPACSRRPPPAATSTSPWSRSASSATRRRPGRSTPPP